MSEANLKVPVGIVVTAAWLMSLFTGLHTHDYQGLQLVTPVMLIFMGYVFGDRFFQNKAKGGNGDGS